MPDIPLLQPQVLRGVVQKLPVPEPAFWLNRVSGQPYPFPVVRWDVIKGSRMVAKPNVPNSEAHIVPRLGVSQESAAFIYLREKKVFEPTTIHWIREPGEIARVNAEKAVLREVSDLNLRFDSFLEWCFWQCVAGGVLTLDYEDVQATVDYKIPATHLTHPAVSWASATAVQMRDDIVAWKRLIARDARVPAREVLLTEKTMGYVFHAFADNPEMFSDRMKDQFFASGMIEGFLGLKWTTVESTYDNDSGVATQWLADDAVIIGNFTDNRPLYYYEGPTADDDAPTGWTGKYSKTWKDKDPSARQYLLEWNVLPILERPEQIVYMHNVTATS